MKLRVKFSKHGAIRYIGHLDVMRFFQKAIRRAGIDVVYTKGYSPHQIMSFASPLGVGLTSNGEYMDIEVQSITSCEDILQRLNSVSVPGIEILSMKILPEEAGNAMASIAAASYTVTIKEERKPGFDIKKALPDFMAQKEIPYVKETKKGERQMDLRPGIFELTWKNDAFHMLLDASSAGNIKPVQVISALFASNNHVLEDNSLIVTREDLFCNRQEDGSFSLISLDEIGKAE